MGDHSEAFQVDFDPQQISYKQLLKVFWSSHNPAQEPFSTQYRSALFYHNASQKLAAEDFAEKLAKARGITIRTPILPASEFTLAEDYHQKYWLRCQDQVMAELQELSKDPKAFVHSTDTMRLNAALGGQRSHDLDASVKAIADRLKLSEHSRRILKLPRNTKCQ